MASPVIWAKFVEFLYIPPIPPHANTTLLDLSMLIFFASSAITTPPQALSLQMMSSIVVYSYISILDFFFAHSSKVDVISLPVMSSWNNILGWL